MHHVMDGQEKMDTCAHRSDAKEVFVGCPCRGQKKTVYECIARSIPEIHSAICAGCPLYKNKNS
jgi:hypothetical protein